MKYLIRMMIIGMFFTTDLFGENLWDEFFTGWKELWEGVWKKNDFNEMRPIEEEIPYEGAEYDLFKKMKVLSADEKWNLVHILTSKKNQKENLIFLALRIISQDPALDPLRKIKVAEQLALFNSDMSADVCFDIATNPEIAAGTRVHAARGLTTLTLRYTKNTSIKTNRDWLESTSERLGVIYKSKAMEAYRSIMNDKTAEVRWRIMAAKELQDFSPICHLEAEVFFLEIKKDPGIPFVYRSKVNDILETYFFISQFQITRTLNKSPISSGETRRRKSF